MKFNLKYKNISKRNITSGEIRKLLSKEGVSVKMAKEPIALAIHSFFGDRRHFQVNNIPHVEVVAKSIDKKVLETHRCAVADKIRRRKEAEERAEDAERARRAEAKVEKAEPAVKKPRLSPRRHQSSGAE